jgi:type II secretory pathway component PulC
VIARAASITTPLTFVLCIFALILPSRGVAADSVEFGRSSCAVETKAQDAPAVKTGADPYAQEVTRKGNRVTISRKLVDATKQDNKIVLSKVAVKSRVDEKGDLRAYELVQIDRGSVVEKVGLKPGDQIVKVNGIPARNLEESRQSLEGSNRFDVTVLRKGKIVKLNVQVR